MVRIPPHCIREVDGSSVSRWRSKIWEPFSVAAPVVRFRPAATVNVSTALSLELSTAYEVRRSQIATRTKWVPYLVTGILARGILFLFSGSGRAQFRASSNTRTRYLYYCTFQVLLERNVVFSNFVPFSLAVCPFVRLMRYVGRGDHADAARPTHSYSCCPNALFLCVYSPVSQRMETEARRLRRRQTHRRRPSCKSRAAASCRRPIFAGTRTAG